jgi:DNA polymerase I-like protein with 3'-5' exonuclease and polymerase domains
LLRAWRTNEALRKELTRLVKLVHPDGRLYPDLDSLGTETGRIVSSKPTLNNLSVESGIRACILPDTPGDIIINPDFSREEPTIFAVEFKVKRLLEDINSGRDIYRSFAAEIYPDIAPESLSSVQLALGKANFLGIGYGEKPDRLIKNAWEKDGILITNEEADRIYKAHQKYAPEIHEAIRQARYAAYHGKIRYGQSKLGRRRLLFPYRDIPTASFLSKQITDEKKRFFGSVAAASKIERLAKAGDPPEGKSPSAKAKALARMAEIQFAREKWSAWEAGAPSREERNNAVWISRERYRVVWDAQTLAINFKIQAGGSDVLRAVEIKLEERLPAPARVIFSNHDEVVVSCPREMREEVSEIIRSTMCECLSADYSGVKVMVKVDSADTWQ